MKCIFAEDNLPKLLVSAISGKTEKWLQDRLESGACNVKLNRVFMPDYDSFQLNFFVKSTHGGTSFIASGETDEDCPDGWYNVYFRFVGVKDYLKEDDLKAAFQKIRKECDVKVYADDPSFYWQGGFEGMSKKHMTIYKFNGEEGDGIWNQRHYDSGNLDDKEVHITKHMAQVGQELDQGVWDRIAVAKLEAISNKRMPRLPGKAGAKQVKEVPADEPKDKAVKLPAKDIDEIKKVDEIEKEVSHPKGADQNSEKSSQANTPDLLDSVEQIADDISDDKLDPTEQDNEPEKQAVEPEPKKEEPKEEPEETNDDDEIVELKAPTSESIIRRILKVRG